MRKARAARPARPRPRAPHDRRLARTDATRSRVSPSSSATRTRARAHWPVTCSSRLGRVEVRRLRRRTGGRRSASERASASMSSSILGQRVRVEGLGDDAGGSRARAGSGGRRGGSWPSGTRPAPAPDSPAARISPRTCRPVHARHHDVQDDGLERDLGAASASSAASPSADGVHRPSRPCSSVWSARPRGSPGASSTRSSGARLAGIVLCGVQGLRECGLVEHRTYVSSARRRTPSVVSVRRDAGTNPSARARGRRSDGWSHEHEQPQPGALAAGHAAPGGLRRAQPGGRGAARSGAWSGPSPRSRRVTMGASEVKRRSHGGGARAGRVGRHVRLRLRRGRRHADLERRCSNPRQDAQDAQRTCAALSFYCAPISPAAARLGRRGGGRSASAPAAAGIRLIACSASAVIVSDGFTPTFAGIAEPSQTSRFS